MFKKTEKKIVLTIALTISFCTILSSIATYIIIRRNILNNFIPLAVQSAAQQQYNLDLFLELTTESSKLLAGDPEIVGVLQKTRVESSEFLSTIDKLNTVQASNLSIIGLTLYGMNGVYYPSNPSNNTANSTPDLNRILKDPVLQKFIGRPEKTLWFDRFQSDYWITDLTLNLYLHNGVFTFVQKITSPKGALTGLLMTDITIDSVHGHFRNNKFNADTYLFSERRGILKPVNGKLLGKAERNEVLNRLNTNTSHFITPDGQKVIIFHRVPHSFDVVIQAIPLGDILGQINQLLSFLVLINIVLIILAIILGVSISRSISWPLGELYSKMQKFFKN